MRPAFDVDTKLARWRVACPDRRLAEARSHARQKALLVMGRDRRSDGSEARNTDQAFDLEVIEREHANMMDILTYDDLLRRLDSIIASLRQRVAMASL